MKTSLRTLAATAILTLSASVVLAQQPTVQERVAALKASLAASQAILKPYEWVETLSVSLKGEEKSRQVNRCYHGADGKVQKLPVSAPPEEKQKRGIRGKIAESKKQEMTDYMKEAVALVKMYVPPDPARIQAAKDAGKVTLQPLPGQKATLTFEDYLKAGDRLAIDVDLASNRPVKASVSTYLDSQKEPVSLDVQFSTLDNNATYVAAVVLEAKAKALSVDVKNTGYRKANP